uniref:18S rRNA (guanine-N(7))-methyltransferase n=1 Tax=Globodera rostochiensis TaxID=31243 RepID=A0A914HF61_GLORO
MPNQKMTSSRPEYSGPPEQYYDDTEARKYTANSRIRKVQRELAQRAYELLELPDTGQASAPALLLDIGCGSGLSGEVLAEYGHRWVGLDISRAMLNVAREDNESDGQLLLADMGAGLPFRPACFDGAISISAVQWLCHSNAKAEEPRRRLRHFFESLHACLCRSARAVFQLYADSDAQQQLISTQALRAGFQGGIIVDRPDSAKHRKVFLVLSAGKAGAFGPSASLLRTTAPSGDGCQQIIKEQIQNVGRSRPWQNAKQKLSARTGGGGGRIEKRRRRREAKRERRKGGECRAGGTEDCDEGMEQ